ncbi:MAG: helix-turn-helix domain-containing protein [Candidatus Limnocylindria bacterium]
MEDWEAVATALNTRMRELRMTQMELAAKSDVSIATIRDLQHNRSPRQRRPRTLAALSAGLGWQPEHLEGVLRGTPPANEGASAVPTAEYTEVMSRLDVIQEEIQSIGSRLSQLEQRVLPADQQPSSGASRDG